MRLCIQYSPAQGASWTKPAAAAQRTEMNIGVDSKGYQILAVICVACGHNGYVDPARVTPGRRFRCRKCSQSGRGQHASRIAGHRVDLGAIPSHSRLGMTGVGLREALAQILLAWAVAGSSFSPLCAHGVAGNLTVLPTLRSGSSLWLRMGVRFDAILDVPRGSGRRRRQRHGTLSGANRTSFGRLRYERRGREG
jgi:hypothetical protein